MFGNEGNYFCKFSNMAASGVQISCLLMVLFTGAIWSNNLKDASCYDFDDQCVKGDEAVHTVLYIWN